MRNHIDLTGFVDAGAWEQRGGALAALLDSDAEIIGHGDKIITAAYQQMNENGVEGLTVRNVLQQAGVNRRVFYARFSGKDDLVLAVFEHSIRSTAEIFRAAAEVMDNPMTTLHFMINHLITAGGTGPMRKAAVVLCREHLRLMAIRPGDLAVTIRPLVDVFCDQLAVGLARGMVRDGPPAQLAQIVFDLVSRTSQAAIIAESAYVAALVNRQALADSVWDFCRRAISCETTCGCVSPTDGV